MEIIPGIHQIRTPIPHNMLGYTNLYLIQGSKGWLLVDTGSNHPATFAALQKQLGEMGLRFRDISQIVITHAHQDHFGLAGKVKQLSQAQLVLHHLEGSLAQPRQTTGDGHRGMMVSLMRQSGMPEAELSYFQWTSPTSSGHLPPPTLPDLLVQGNETISTGLFTFRVIWTPGHSPGHICLYETSKKILISGDHILPIITPNVSQYDPQLRRNPLRDYLSSLQALETLEADLVLPGHEHIFENLPQRIRELLHHHEQRLATIQDILKAGPKSIYEIASGIRWIIKYEGDPGITFHSLDIPNRGSAMGETTSHLELLRKEGKVERFFQENITCYKTTGNH